MNAEFRLNGCSRRLAGLAGLVATVGCSSDVPDPARTKRARVDAVTVKAPAPADVDGFCDVRRRDDTAPDWQWPTLHGPGPAATTGWQWVNVWATWCRPCVEELPMLARLRGRFAADHLPLTLAFLSADESMAEVEKFKARTPGVPETMLIAPGTEVPEWLAKLGLAGDSALPLHFFIDPAGKVRCVRIGGMAEKDYDAVRALVRGG